MPYLFKLTDSQEEQISTLHPQVVRVLPWAVMGASPLARVVWKQSCSTSIKFFKSISIYTNEVRALTLLEGSRFVPCIFGHGKASPPLLLPEPSNDLYSYEFWLCRQWIKNGDTFRLPIARPQEFAVQLLSFTEECTGAGLKMGDGKRSNFSWDGTSLMWLDFGWFYPTENKDAKEHNQKFCEELLHKLGW